MKHILKFGRRALENVPYQEQKHEANRLQAKKFVLGALEYGNVTKENCIAPKNKSNVT